MRFSCSLPSSMSQGCSSTWEISTTLTLLSSIIIFFSPRLLLHHLLRLHPFLVHVIAALRLFNVSCPKWIRIRPSRISTPTHHLRRLPWLVHLLYDFHLFLELLQSTLCSISFFLVLSFMFSLQK